MGQAVWGCTRVRQLAPADVSLAALIPLPDKHHAGGRVTGLQDQCTGLDELCVGSVEFNECDLSSLTWPNSKITRVRSSIALSCSPSPVAETASWV